MASEPTPQVNDEDVAKDAPVMADLGGATLSQLVGDYADHLRATVALIDREWGELLRPRLNMLIHAMESETEVVP